MVSWGVVCSNIRGFKCPRVACVRKSASFTGRMWRPGDPSTCRSPPPVVVRRSAYTFATSHVLPPHYHQLRPIQASKSRQTSQLHIFRRCSKGSLGTVSGENTSRKHLARTPAKNASQEHPRKPKTCPKVSARSTFAWER
jgi:hypothetical protein